jgi:hypothetical protein
MYAQCITRVCCFCGGSFEFRGSRNNPRLGLFCSRRCSSRHKGQQESRPIEERFWRWVEKTEGCWNWTGDRNLSGYGRIWCNTKKKTVLAHRVAFVLHGNDLDDDLLLRHSCDNKLCVNPAHLLPGTSQDNANDAMERGRLMRGEQVNTAKLTEAQVREIRQRYAAGETCYNWLARDYPITGETLRGIVWRKSWKHVL